MTDYAFKKRLGQNDALVPINKEILCPQCKGLLVLVDEDNVDEKHWAGFGPGNQLYSCWKCEYRGLESQIRILERVKELGEVNVRDLAHSMGETFYYHKRECGFSGNWDVMVDEMPYRPAAPTFEEFVQLLSKRELRLAARYSRKGTRTIWVPKIVGF